MLSACAAPMRYDSRLGSWAGAPEEELTVLTSGPHTRPPQGAEPEQRVMQRLLERVREGGG